MANPPMPYARMKIDALLFSGLNTSFSGNTNSQKRMFREFLSKRTNLHEDSIVNALDDNRDSGTLNAVIIKAIRDAFKLGSGFDLAVGVTDKTGFLPEDEVRILFGHLIDQRLEELGSGIGYLEKLAAYLPFFGSEAFAPSMTNFEARDLRSEDENKTSVAEYPANVPVNLNINIWSPGNGFYLLAQGPDGSVNWLCPSTIGYRPTGFSADDFQFPNSHGELRPVGRPGDRWKIYGVITKSPLRSLPKRSYTAPPGRMDEVEIANFVSELRTQRDEKGDDAWSARRYDYKIR